MENIIRVDRNLCIGCSACVNDCPQKNIRLDSNKKAVIKSQECIKCGHCSAICPKGAVEISGYKDEIFELKELKKLDPDILMDALYSRRSIRKFKDKKVEKEKLKKIIEAGRRSPTGKNSQNVRYIILDRQKRDFENMAVSIFKKLIFFLKIFKKNFRGFKIDEDFFFKKAPLAILVISDNDVDGSLAASNMALMAESLDLGVLYSGFFTFAVRLSKKMRKKLNLSKKQKVVTTIVTGYPAVKYKRTTHKKEAKVDYR